MVPPARFQRATFRLVQSCLCPVRRRGQLTVARHLSAGDREFSSPGNERRKQPSRMSDRTNRPVILPRQLSGSGPSLMSTLVLSLFPISLSFYLIVGFVSKPALRLKPSYGCLIPGVGHA